MQTKLAILILLCGVAVGQTVCPNPRNCDPAKYICPQGQSCGWKPEPFDVPPVRKKAVTEFEYWQCAQYPQFCGGESASAAVIDSCTDTRRTLLYSIDGKGHCYAFYQLKGEN